MLASSVTRIPRCERDDDRPRLEHEPRVRECEADQVEQPEQTLRQQEPEEEADDRGDDPTTSASTITDPRIWRFVAPIVRSVANSRVRCAIVIESEFAMTNEPTKSAIPPNASRNVRAGTR